MKLIFVYNANSGLLNALKDSVHKTFKPSTYPCSLCALTYGSVSEKKIWKNFHEKSSVEMEFLHVDEFEEKYSKTEIYPVVLKDEGKLVTVLSATEMDSISTVEKLINKIEYIISEN